MSTATAVKRASLDELKEFANKVRAAGGGNPLDALMPSVPEDGSQCLIAKNLNFNCAVYGLDSDTEERSDGGSHWHMVVESKDLRDQIADTLGLAKVDHEEYLGWDAKTKEEKYEMKYGIRLPEEIGEVAAEFDRAMSIIKSRWNPKTLDYEYSTTENASVEELERLKEFWPYIDESEKEAYANATFVNPDGTIVI